MKYSAINSEINWITPFKIINDFCSLGLDSLLIGLVLGLISSLTLKHYRELSKNPVAESFGSDVVSSNASLWLTLFCK